MYSNQFVQLKLNFFNYTITPNPLSVVRVGFQQQSYNVEENVGVFSVCVVVIMPLDSQPLDRTFSLSVSTRPGTAGMSLKVAVHSSGLNN